MCGESVEWGWSLVPDPPSGARSGQVRLPTPKGRPTLPLALTFRLGADERQAGAARLVALGDVLEHVEHRRGGRRAVAARRCRVDLAHGRLAAEVADHDVVADR